MTVRKREFSTQLDNGTIGCTLSFEGERVPDLPEMLDNIQNVVSKQVGRVLIPALRNILDGEPTGGGTTIEETVRVEFLDHVVALDIKLELNYELDALHETALRFVVIAAVAPAVMEDALNRFARRSLHETADKINEQSLKEMLASSPVVGGLGKVFGGIFGGDGPGDFVDSSGSEQDVPASE